MISAVKPDEPASNFQQRDNAEAEVIGGGNSQNRRFVLSESRGAFAVQPSRPGNAGTATVLPQIRKDHRIVGADNLCPYEHVAVEPDVAREFIG